MAVAAHAFLVDYRGVSVPQVTELRDKIRETGGQYVVVKNRLMLRAIEGAAIEGLKEHFEGTVAVAYTNDDPVALAKALSDFSKDVPAIEFKAGLVDGQAGRRRADRADRRRYPSREELVAKLLFLLQSPIARFVQGSRAAGPQQLVDRARSGRRRRRSKTNQRRPPRRGGATSPSEYGNRAPGHRNTASHSGGEDDGYCYAEDFIKQIDEMTVLELNELVKALEDHYGVSAAAAADAVAGAAGGGGKPLRPRRRTSSTSC